MLLANLYNPEKHNPTGWYISEKLDGIRAMWNPITRKFISRNGNEFNVPEEFKKGAPNVFLDGELWHSRNSFEKTCSIVKTINNPDKEAWKTITFMIFDIVSSEQHCYEKRLEILKNLQLPYNFKVIDTWICEGPEHLSKELERFEKLGSEGLMLRKPGSYYEKKRSDTLLKVKYFYDSEATVIGHFKGTGRLSSMIGGLVVSNETGTFKIGSGLDDYLRKEENVPKIGTIITYKYYGLTKNGKPRSPIFLRIRNDN